MDQSEEQPFQSAEHDANTDPIFKQQVQRLHYLTVYGRWLFVGLLWSSIAPLCLWNLRSEIVLWRQYLTWVAVRYGLYYHPLATLGLAFCMAMTVAVLVWQSRNILLGLPPSEQRRLEQQIHRMRQQGPNHPLWIWVARGKY